MTSRPTDRAAARTRTAALAALGLAQAALYFLLAIRDGHTEQPMVTVLIVLVTFALYLTARVAARPLDGKTPWIIAIVLGATFRILLLPEQPALSDDFWRYLWDGRVQMAGLNPYAHPPADPGLTTLGATLQSQVNHPDVHTIYPPLAQIAFLLVAVVPGGLIPLKLIWLLCDIGIASLLYRLVPTDRRLTAWLTYWWSPLVVVEVAWNAHLDPLGILPLVAALALVRPGSERRIGTGLALAGAALVKYFPVLLLPAATRRLRSWRVPLAFAAAAILLYLPHLGAGPDLFSGLLTYARLWQFNAGLYAVLAAATGPTAAKVVGAAFTLGVVIQSVRNGWGLERTAFWVVGSVLVFAPTVHPWYLLWIVPLLALRPNRAWLYLTGSVFLAYYGLGLYRATGAWPEPWPLKLVIYGPFYVLLLLDAWRGSWWQTAFGVIVRRRIPGTARETLRTGPEG